MNPELTKNKRPMQVSETESFGRPLIDRFGRLHESIRISVTDQCNIRCQYCMPADVVKFLPKQHLLSFEQIETITRAASRCGIRHVRITGGEPLLRPNLQELIANIKGISAIEEIALTTNGMLLASQLPQLVAAGLNRLNISLDTLSDETFKRLARREGLQRVLEGIRAAKQFPSLQIKLNALVLRDVNLLDVIELVKFAVSEHLHLRFIEFMPLDSERSWSRGRMVPGSELRALVAEHFEPLQPCPVTDPSQPAVDYWLPSHGIKLGFIDSVSQPFCGGCDRVRITADGKIRNCLFGRDEWDLSSVFSESPSRSSIHLEQRIAEIFRQAVDAKHASHGIEDPGFEPPERAMYQIGG
jgi:cyclic pyranopterin phosphate synthase